MINFLLNQAHPVQSENYFISKNTNSKKIGQYMLVVNSLCGAHLSRGELNEFMLIILVNFHHTCLITTPVAIIRSRPYSNQHFLFKVVSVPLFHQLMCSCNSFKVVKVQELLGYLFGE